MADLRRDWLARIVPPDGRPVSDFAEYFQWKNGDLLAAMRSLATLLNRTIPEALGPAGRGADADELVYVARRIIDVYRYLLEWGADFRFIRVEPDLARLVKRCADVPSGMIRELDRFMREYQTFVNRIPSAITGGTPLNLNLTLDFGRIEIEPVTREMNRIARQRRR